MKSSYRWMNLVGGRHSSLLRMILMQIISGYYYNLLLHLPLPKPLKKPKLFLSCIADSM